jgi:acetolactate synthase-1/2/3 large subunit
MTGGRAVVEALRSEGIQHVFGIVGTHSVHLFDGLFDEPAVRGITARHEQGAALMALGYARASGRIAACFTVPGPGLTNALTGLGMAYAESVPLLLVTGQNPLATLDRGHELFHELRNSLVVAGSVSSYVMRATTISDIPRIVREAMRSMRTQRPRPAVIEVPLDVLGGEAEVELLPADHVARPIGHPGSIARAAELLREAERPIILVGGGVVSAAGEQPLRKLAEQLGAPVITSAFAKGVIPEDHALSLGDGWGQLGELYAEVLDRSDLVLLAGARLDVLTDAKQGAGLPGTLIQIDLDPLVIGRHHPVEIGIVGDAALVLEALASKLDERTESRACWLDVAAFRARRRERLAERAGPLVQIWDDLRSVLPTDSIVVDDLTLVGYWAPLLFETYQARTLLHAGTYGTLGYALPVAIGAKIACPEQPTVAIVGDGGFLYTVQELATARAEHLDLIVLVFNDNAFGALKTYQDRFFGGRQIGSELVNPDFVKLAEAFGIHSARVEAADISGAVKRALQQGGVWLLEVPFSPSLPAALPPWMP